MKNLKLLKQFISFLAIIVFMILAYASGDNTNVGSSTIDLKASVSFTGTQFIIKNNDNFTYTNAKLEVNRKYVLTGKDLKPGESYSVGMMQFADDDGNRLNSMIKPLSFSIWCDLNDNKNGFYYAEWQ